MADKLLNPPTTEYEGFMSVDYKSAKHICNVIRRQVQSCYPDLHIHFTIHKENEREKAFISDTAEISEHPAGKYMLNYPDIDAMRKILEQNRTQFIYISRFNNPGFLGVFQNNAYLALCFLNYTRFDTIDDLKSHTLHISWHAIALYKEYINYRRSKDKKASYDFTDNYNIIIPKLDNYQRFHRNLMGDIFSASVQTLQGKEKAFETLSKQRIIDTLTPKTGFRAEEFPFPICIDTLGYLFKDNIKQYKKNKKTIQSAVKITEDIGNTHTSTSIEQWQSFSSPSQQLAWIGYNIETILGAALYTSDNTYVQSIADMISENISKKPEIITNIQDYNPYTNQEVNSRLHKKLCRELLETIQRNIANPEDYNLIIDIINKQNISLKEGKVMGWCVPALIPMADMIRKCPTDDIFENVFKDAICRYEEEVNNITWETLSELSKQLFHIKRDNGHLSWDDILDFISQNDEFSSIHCGIMLARQINDESKSQKTPNNMNNTDKHKKTEVNITNFISPNAIKRTK